MRKSGFGWPQAAARAMQFAVITIVVNLIIGAIFGFPPLPRFLLTLPLVWASLMAIWLVQVLVLPRLFPGRGARSGDGPPAP